MAIPEYDDPSNSYVLTIDSSKIAHGTTLTQLINGKRRVILVQTGGASYAKNGCYTTRIFGPILIHSRLYHEGVKSFVVKKDCKILIN